MKNSKKGISLIVLIITIIVIVILATAILVSVITNNPISEANKARYESDRDNMQAVFTNTVGKIMAENQGVVNVTAGQINTKTTGVSETTGEVEYTVDNATNEANATGTIIFDKGTNDATTYYTGKKLPIYAAGETKWYVDSEGVLSLEVAGVKYGSSVSEGGAPSEEETLAPGLYAEDGTMTYSWQDLLDDGYLIINEGTLNSDEGNKAFGGQTSSKKLIGKLVIDDSITTIGLAAFCGCKDLTSILIQNGVEEIGNYAFMDCDNLTTIELPNTLNKMNYQLFYNNNEALIIKYNGSMTEWQSIYQEQANCTDREIIVHCIDGNTVLADGF